MSLPSSRRLNLAAFLACAGLLGFSGWLQFGLGLEVCPLCVVQRLLFVALGLLFLLAAALAPAGRRVMGLLVGLFALAGMLVAARHLWLQGLPADQVPSCGPGLQYILGTFKPWEAFSMVLGGSGECAKVDWRFLGLSIPGWALIWFAIFFVGGLWQTFRRDESR